MMKTGQCSLSDTPQWQGLCGIRAWLICLLMGFESIRVWKLITSFSVYTVYLGSRQVHILSCILTCHKTCSGNVVLFHLYFEWTEVSCVFILFFFIPALLNITFYNFIISPLYLPTISCHIPLKAFLIFTPLQFELFTVEIESPLRYGEEGLQGTQEHVKKEREALQGFRSSSRTEEIDWQLL